MRNLILISLLGLILACSEAPFQPQEPTPEEIIADLREKLAQKSLDSARWYYLARCCHDWFEANGIEPPCHANPVPVTPAMTMEDRTYQTVTVPVAEWIGRRIMRIEAEI